MGKYTPQVFIAPSPQAEALGQPMLAFFKMIEYVPLGTVLKDNGLDSIEADQWYPMQSALNVFKALYEYQTGTNYDLVMIGMKAMESIIFPSEVNSIDAALTLISQIPRLFSRNVPDDFGFLLEKVDAQRILITNNTPIPDPSVYGFIWTIVNKCKPSHEVFVVRTLPEQHDHSTTFEVIWELAEDGPYV